MFDWEDLRALLALGASASVKDAAQKSNGSEVELLRRIRALEKQLGLPLFEQARENWVLTREGRAIFAAASDMEDAARRVMLRAQHLTEHHALVIRVTTNHAALDNWGDRIIADYRRANPQVMFDVEAAEHHTALHNGRADVALRAADQIQGDDLIARALTPIPWSVYCSQAYADVHGVPNTLDECAGRAGLVYSNDVADKIACAGWFNTQLDQDRIVQTLTTVPTMAGVLQDGRGIGALPRIVGDLLPELVRCFDHEKLAHTLWIVTTRERYEDDLIRSFFDFSVEFFAQDSLRRSA
ncbi:MAG: LysR family transcriptional regulator [Pseudomonadota bacterium]